MKIEIFKDLLGAANKKLVELALSNGDVVAPKNVYVLISWWNNNYRPLDYIVAAPCSQLFIGEDRPELDNQSQDDAFAEMKTIAWKCQTYSERSWMPCPFAINQNAWAPDQVVLETRTLDYVEEAMSKINFGSIRVRVDSNPFDQIVDIDPWETRIIRDPSKRVMLCFGISRKLAESSRGVYGNLRKNGFLTDELPCEYDWKISSDMIKILDYYEPNSESCGCAAGA